MIPTSKRPLVLIAILLAGLGMSSDLRAQALPQLENSFRNDFIILDLDGPDDDIGTTGDNDVYPYTDPSPIIPGPRTGNQFQSGTAFGGWVATRIKDGSTIVAGSSNETEGAPGAILSPSFTPLLPDLVTPDTTKTIQMVQVISTRSMVARTVSFSIGGEIPRPDRKPNGSPLDPLVFEDREFYFKEPVNADTGRFYYSPHAETVFATEPGLVQIDWKERVTGNIFTQVYTISGSPVKPTKKLFWTERDFNGPLVAVPDDRVKEVKPVFNALFPEQVALTESHDYDPDNPYDPEAPGTSLPPIQKTFWQEFGFLHAYNVEGRVFVELLGDLRGIEQIHREHLGFELVDVVKEVRPNELKVSIGERVLAADEDEITPEEEDLVPAVVAGLGLDVDPYLFEHSTLGGTKNNLYAIRATTPISVLDLNGDGEINELDEQQSNEVLIYWKEEGVMQLLWPERYVGYIFKWPEEFLDNEDEWENPLDYQDYLDDKEDYLRNLYSLYARPEGSDDWAATGVQLSSNNNPVLTYQDDESRQHANLTPQNVFYTIQGTGKRALIRYTNGEEIWFERVYSQANTDFDGYENSDGALVGSRIDPPDEALDLVGYIHQASGNAFNPGAYLDPFVVGFENAAEGAIIPVNAVDENDQLEVWWYEQSTPPAGTGFSGTRWPSLVKNYQLAWPPDDANLYEEIVLARNDGSGDLGPAATGTIYRQADESQPGYNPNEEHALMSGGVAWAIRDDLNKTTSSEPFVLVDYIDPTDGRPAMVVRRVVRENATHTFEYEAEAGSVLQAPMPLAIMPPPLGEDGRSLNQQVPEELDGPNIHSKVYYRERYDYWTDYTFRDRKGTVWVYRGPHNENDEGDASFQMHFFYKTQDDFDFPTLVAPPVGTAIPYLSADPISDPIESSIPLEIKINPKWPANAPTLQVAESLITPKRGLPAVRGQSSLRVLYDQALANSSEVDGIVKSVRLHDPTRAKVSLLEAGGLFKIPDSVVTSDNLGKTYFPNLPPHLSERVFLDPNQGPLGGISVIGQFADDAFGDDHLLLNTLSPEEVDAVQGLCDDTDPLKSVWDSTFAVVTEERSNENWTTSLDYEYIDLPNRILSRIRVVDANDSQKFYRWGRDFHVSLNRLRLFKTQNSSITGPVDISYYGIASSGTTPTFVNLTNQSIPGTYEIRKYDTGYTSISRGSIHLKAPGNTWNKRANGWPIRNSQGYARGKDYFITRNDSTNNIIINRTPGSAIPEGGGFDVIFVPSTSASPANTVLETLVEDPDQRGTFNVDPRLNRRSGLSSLTEIGPYSRGQLNTVKNELSGTGIQVTEDNTPVDSYALTADGGGTGYVTLLSGNGAALTPAGDPVSMHVFRVEEQLYRGELKTAPSANPLDDKFTLHHSGDFAGDPQDFEFQWLYAQPVGGSPPEVYTFNPTTILPNDGSVSWTRYQNPSSALVTSSTAYGFDDLPAPWVDHGLLSSNEVIINDGNGNGDEAAGVLMREVFEWTNARPLELYLSLELAANDGARVLLNGVEIVSTNVAGVTDTPIATAPDSLNNVLSLVFSVSPSNLQEQNTLQVLLSSESDAGAGSTFDIRLDGVSGTENITTWQALGNTVKDDPGTTPTDESAGEIEKMRHTIQGANILTLTDNYYIMRYRALPGTAAARATGGDQITPGEWSIWSEPQLVEGWIKRALGGINPFEQRITDLFNNAINTDVSLLTQAGARWEGDVALNLENIDDFGLIEIYETIFKRGKKLSIEGAIPLNVPAANDALLLASGYLSDLYLTLGNEAFADAANPTIAFDTESGDFGEFNTALFAFKGQLSTVLDEELVLLRGRDDTMQPGVSIAPVYNRLVWNFTGGINSGEPIYSLNYNIQDLNTDGAADAEDAAVQFPQGHGDAYGHYLTALTGYYSLLHSDHFAWTPRIEAVSVLGQPVSIDYQDERKFAAAASAVSRTASQVADLTYRKEFTANANVGWQHLRDSDSDRAWGTDQWTTRGGQGAYFHWVTANSILPAEDTVNTGIEKVDRTTVPELDEVVAQVSALQETLDNADARLNPLGLAAGSVPFDISPSEIDAGKTHYEQVYERALGALSNAVFAFNNAKQSTQFLRLQDNSVADQTAAIEAQEQAFENELIEIYGTPYPDDIGPGKTYAQGFAGPDLLHFGYIETPELFFDPSLASQEYALPLDPAFLNANSAILQVGETVSYQIDSLGNLVKPDGWSGQRSHPGELQTSLSDLLAARQRLRESLDRYNEVEGRMTELLNIYKDRVAARTALVGFEGENASLIEDLEAAIRSTRVIIQKTTATIQGVISAAEAIAEAFPRSVGFSVDATSVPRAIARGIGAATATASAVAQAIDLGRELGLIDEVESLEDQIAVKTEETAWAKENAQMINDLREALNQFRDRRTAIDVALRNLDQSERNLQALKARGLAIQAERETFRKRAAAIVQGYRTRDLAFRVFRDEALEKYKTLFDLSARYTYLAARAYDYETGLLDANGSSAAASFFNDIVQSRALGVVDSNGDPQFTASTTGDPGLAGVLAAMQGDWSVAESRLGFNNPDNYETTFSLRQEQFRIIPADTGDGAWRDQLSAFRKADVLDDPDVRRYCMQIANSDGLPVPGLVIPFQTTIADGMNFFGQPLAGGDHTFSPSSFTTKIRSSGIAFDGYIGMDAPTSTSGPLDGAGSSSPPDPDLGFLDPSALSATPYVYLIPAGVDSMRSPPLGDTSFVRTWSVQDQAIPLPFNIGNTDFSTNDTFLSAESLSEDPFQIRKHQAFRAVPSGTVFSGSDGFTNSRLIGRSAWNSNWKLVIPGKTLRANPEIGLDVFIDSVTDIELFLKTYSYSGN